MNDQEKLKAIKELNEKIVFRKLMECIEEMTVRLAGFSHSEYINVMKTLAKMANIVRHNPRNKKAREELNRLLDKWEQKFENV